MRAVIVALSVNGAMGQYVHCLCSALGESAQVTFAGPSHFAYKPENYTWLQVKTGANRRAAALRLLNPFLGAKMWRAILATKPDVVHFLNGESYPWALVGVPLLKRAKVPWICTVHDARAHSKDFYGKISEVLRRPVLQSAAALHVHTEEAKALVKKTDCPICIIPHGSFGPLYTKHRRPGIEREKTILFFGRIEYYKGVDVLLRAKRLLPPDWKLTIAGPGAPTPDLLKLIAETSNVELINRYLNNAEVAELFQRASVCALPYRDASQSSVPLISAAFDVPVVASAVGGFREDVPKVNGVLVPPGDPEALAHGISNAYGRPVRSPSELEFSSLRENFLKLYHETSISKAR